MKIQIFLLTTLAISFESNALDLTKMVCSSPELSEAELTRKCKDSGIEIRDTICQGNEGKVWCKSAILDLGDPAKLKVELGFRNKHVWRVKNDLVNWSTIAYDSSSTGTLTADLNNDCTLTNYQVEHSNAMGAFLLGLAKLIDKSVTDELPKRVPDCE